MTMKKIKFALKMKDGAEVRDLQSLKDAFDSEMLMGYLLDGKLETWLADRYYDDLADQVGALDKSDPELADILDAGYETIYLCGEGFKIPTRVKNRKYIGIRTALELTPEQMTAYREKGIELVDLVKPGAADEAEMSAGREPAAWEPEKMNVMFYSPWGLARVSDEIKEYEDEEDDEGMEFDNSAVLEKLGCPEGVSRITAARNVNGHIWYVGENATGYQLGILDMNGEGNHVLRKWDEAEGVILDTESIFFSGRFMIAASKIDGEEDLSFRFERVDINGNTKVLNMADSAGGGAEVTTRLFGNFLTWMQEKTSPAFVVATANDVTKIPPEMMRKGRFDEIFYIGLPEQAERRKIFEIHIGKRRPQDLKKIDLDDLARQTEGFSGADIEGVVKDGIETAFAADRGAVTTAEIEEAIRNTSSLMQIMGDSLNVLIREYEKRRYKNAS